MTDAQIARFEPDLDLVLERVVDVPVALVWAAWTEPERLKKWFTPKPWQTVGCEIDLRPGGVFKTVMRSPDGHEFPNAGCYLEVVPQRRLVFTNTLGPGFRPMPVSQHAPVFTAILALAPQDGGTRYTATLLHKDQDGRAKHEAMGFHTGWSTALDQLVAMCKADGT